MKRLRFAKRAQEDLDQIWDYLGVVQGDPVAAHRQLELLYEKCVMLASQPLLG